MTVDDLLSAYRTAAGEPRYGARTVQVWNDHVLDCMCRCFGVSFDGEAAAPLRAVLVAEARLPHPLGGALEATLFEQRFEVGLRSLDAPSRELADFYHRHAVALASALWGELGERTDDQLRATGWDPSREPKLDDFIDEI